MTPPTVPAKTTLSKPARKVLYQSEVRHAANPHVAE
jgi:hypothetical protein